MANTMQLPQPEHGYFSAALPISMYMYMYTGLPHATFTQAFTPTNLVKLCYCMHTQQTYG